MDKVIEIVITDEQEFLAIEKDRLRQAAKHVLDQHGVRAGSVSVAIVDDERIKQLKERYFDVSATTDVISFDLRDVPNDFGGGGVIDCEIVINAQTAVRTATDRGGDPTAELCLYAVHGLLHQLGYDDQDEEQYEKMHARENELLEQLGYGKVF